MRMRRIKVKMPVWILSLVASAIASAGACGAPALTQQATEAIENHLASRHGVEFHFGTVTVRSALASRFEAADSGTGAFGIEYLERLNKTKELGLVAFEEKTQPNPLDAFRTMGALGAGLASQQERRLRFRSVLKLDQFKHQWDVVAVDIGSMDVDRWDSSNVK